MSNRAFGGNGGTAHDDASAGLGPSVLVGDLGKQRTAMVFMPVWATPLEELR